MVIASWLSRRRRRTGDRRVERKNSAQAELEAGQLARVLPDWDFGSMEVNELFVSGKTIKPAARAFADFLLRELRAA
jgi:DNA-binding transcriptional LysR family regulator